MASLNGDRARSASCCGVVLGLGLWLIVSAVPRVGRPRLVERVAPYVADLSAEARAMVARRPADPSPVLGVIIDAGGRLGSAACWLDWLGGNDVIARRLRQAGSTASVERFRGEQLAWAAAGVRRVAAVALACWLQPSRAMPTVAAAGAAVPRRGTRRGARAIGCCSRRAKRRLARISAELPTVLEFLTLSLTAGEGMLDAIRRVARRRSRGASHASSLRVVPPSARAFRSARRSPTCATDSIIPRSRARSTRCSARSNGARPSPPCCGPRPAMRARQAKRTIIELAGRKEIAMLVPLIFLILPVTIAFALFPGYLVLQAGF